MCAPVLKCHQLQEALLPDLPLGALPSGPPLGALPQTPVIGSHSHQDCPQGSSAGIVFTHGPIFRFFC